MIRRHKKKKRKRKRERRRGGQKGIVARGNKYKREIPVSALEEGVLMSWRRRLGAARHVKAARGAPSARNMQGKLSRFSSLSLVRALFSFSPIKSAHLLIHIRRAVTHKKWHERSSDQLAHSRLFCGHCCSHALCERKTLAQEGFGCTLARRCAGFMVSVYFQFPENRVSS